MRIQLSIHLSITGPFCSNFSVRADAADLDDTLVLTGEADLKAYGDVAALAQQRFPTVRGPLQFKAVCVLKIVLTIQTCINLFTGLQVDVQRLLQAWQLLFVQWPWDVTDKVRACLCCTTSRQCFWPACSAERTGFKASVANST